MRRAVLFLLVSVLFMQLDILKVHAQLPTISEHFKVQTDRVIVEVKKEDGNVAVESISWEQYAKMSNAQIIEPDYIRSVSAETPYELTGSWAIERIQMNQMLNQFANQQGEVIVAIVDSGVDYTHPYLKNRLVSGYDFVDNDTTPMDLNAHGTHVAGIVAQSTTENVKIMPIRALDADGNGYDSNIAKGIYYAIDNGAQIINMSFEGEKFSTYLSDAIKFALSKNVIVVAAAGNNRSSTDNFYPASEQSIIVVSAVDSSDVIADFSNTGQSIDISAPGVDVISTLPGGRYGAYNGTSMAAPFVVGAVAMMKLNKPEASVEEIERWLKQYVDDRGEVGWDEQYGEGILNLASFEKYSYVSELYHSGQFKLLGDQTDVNVSKEWRFIFNRRILPNSIETVFLYDDTKPTGTVLDYEINNRTMTIQPSNFIANEQYAIVVQLTNGKKYILRIHTAY